MKVAKHCPANPFPELKGRGKEGEGRVSSTSRRLILALAIEYHAMYFSPAQKPRKERIKT